MPKKSAVVRFLSLPDPMRGIRRNKGFFPVDLLENTHVGKKCWGLVFYGVKSKLLDYYRPRLKYPTARLTLDALENFINEHGIPRMIIMDSDGVLGAVKKRKHIIRENIHPLRLSKTDKQNQNSVYRAIKNLKSGLSKISNACGTGFLSYHWKAM